MSIDSEELAKEELLLQEADFPDNYKQMAHLHDYEPLSNPFVNYISHFSGRHNRLIVRMCWLHERENKYMPMSFVCDTGAPMGFYLSGIAYRKLREIKRLKEDETGNEYVVIENMGKIAVEPTPQGHKPANIMGLRILTKMQLRLCTDNSFLFLTPKKAL